MLSKEGGWRRDGAGRNERAVKPHRSSGANLRSFYIPESNNVATNTPHLEVAQLHEHDDDDEVVKKLKEGLLCQI